MRIRLLGKLGVFDKGKWLEPRPSKPLCLLLYAAYYGDWLDREKLGYLFWPDVTEKTSQQNVRSLIHRSKEYSFAADLEIEKTRLRWQPETDLSAFREACDSQDWGTAVRLYDRGLLWQFTPKHGAGFDAWLEHERSEVRRLWHKAVHAHVKQLEANENYEDALGLLEKLLASDPLSEDILQRYLRYSYLLGKREEALKAFETFKVLLEHELGLTPLEDTVELVTTIQSASSLTTRSSAAPVPSVSTHVPPTVLTPPELIARDEELAQVKRAFSPVVSIAGEAGVGKSALMRSAAPDAKHLRCQEGLESVPYFPLIKLIRSFVQGGKSVPELGHYLDDLARLIPELAPRHKPGPADPETGRSRLFEALARYFEAVLDTRQSFQLLIDDAQWADESTLAFLIYLAQRKSLNLLLAYRVHEVSPALTQTLQSLRSSKLITEVDLKALDEHDVKQFIASLMETSEGPPLFSRWLYRGTGGNPMFMLETLKSLFESGILHLDNKDWQTDIDNVTKDYSEIDIPEAIHGVVARRVDKLPDETQRVLQVASVIGDGFSARQISQVSGLSEWAVLHSLEEAEERALISEQAFAHDLLRQSIYKSLASTRRKLLHRSLAESATESSSRLAEHWFLAGEANKAANVWQSAARALMEKGLLTEASELLARAETAAHDERLLEDLKLDMAKLYFQQAAYDEAIEKLDPLLLSCQDNRTATLAHILQAQLLAKKGRLQEAYNFIQQGFKVSQQIKEDDLDRQVNLVRASILFDLNEFDKASALLEPLLPILRQKEGSLELAKTLTDLAAIYNEQGNYEKALGLHLEAFDLANKLGARHLQVDIAQNLVYCYIELGRSEEALPIGEEALDFGHYEMTDSLRANLAAAYVKLEAFDKAIHHYSLLTSSNEAPVCIVAWGRLAGLYGLTNQAQKCREAIDCAFDLLPEQITPVHARVLVSTLRYGTQPQLGRALPLLSKVNTLALPPYMRQELDEALEIAQESHALKLSV